MRVAKGIIKGNSNYDEKYIIGNATIEDLVCNVKFVPKFSSGTMTYDVTYEVSQGRYDYEYDQIIYNLDKKTKTKFIEPETGKITIQGWQAAQYYN